MKNILEVSGMCQPRFPRAAALLEVLALAELLRSTAAAIEILAESAWRTDPATLRRSTHALVRATVAQLEGRVSL